MKMFQPPAKRTILDAFSKAISTIDFQHSQNHRQDTFSIKILRISLSYCFQGGFYAVFLRINR